MEASKASKVGIKQIWRNKIAAILHQLKLGLYWSAALLRLVSYRCSEEFSMSKPSAIYGLILAGGQASRMQGQDKGLIHFKGRPLIEHVIAGLKNQVDAIYISCNRNFSEYQQFGFPLVSDFTENTVPSFEGPLAGIIHGASKIPAELILVVPCDGLFLPPDIAKRLSQAIADNQTEVAVVHDGQYIQPLYCLLNKSVLSKWAQAYEQGERSVIRCLQLQNYISVDFSSDSDHFKNINTPDDLAKLQQKKAH